MAYYPGAGVKKPLNIIEGPMFPDIKETLPRFVDAKKHWTVDTGATILDTGHLDQTLNGAILAQSRSYNQTVYGQSSSKDVVNKNFRPPLLSQDDFLPLSRQPRKIVVPRINPSGVADSFFKQNNHLPEIDSYLTDRIKAGEWRPTFFAPITFPNDSNAIVPDLELTLPHYSATAGVNTPVRVDAPPQIPVLVGGREEFTLLLDSGVNIPLKLDGDVVRDFNRLLNRPHYSAGAGVNTPVTIDMKTPLSSLELNENRPRYAAGAGVNTPATIDMETPLTQLELQANRPRYAVEAGINTPATIDMETPLKKLELQSQLDSKLFSNPGSAVFDGHDYTGAAPAQLEKVGHTLPQVSYIVPPTTSVTVPNNRAIPASFTGMREKVKPDTSSYTSSSSIPRSGLNIPKVSLKQVNNKTAMESQYSLTA